jgi:hypothetical protein
MTRYLLKSRNSHFIWKSPANAGLFSGGGYVQDERYTAGAGRAGAVPLSFARCLAHGQGESGSRSRGWPWPRAGAVRLSFAPHLATCMGAKAAQYLASGHAVKHPCALILDVLSRKVLKQGTVHPWLNGNTYSNGFR